MRFRLLILVALAAVLGVSAATAAPGKGKPGDSARARCSKRPVLLMGALASKADSSFTMTVKRSNRRALKGASVTVNVDSSTKMRRDGKAATLTDLVAGDRLLVGARACRDASSPESKVEPVLTARRVLARSAKAAAEPSS